MDTKDYDAEVRNADAAIGNFLAEYGGVFSELLERMKKRDDAITAGIVAKSAAPRQLSAEEACRLYCARREISFSPDGERRLLAAFAAVLAECRRRDLACIEHKIGEYEAGYTDTEAAQRELELIKRIKGIIKSALDGRSA